MRIERFNGKNKGVKSETMSTKHSPSTLYNNSRSLWSSYVRRRSNIRTRDHSPESSSTSTFQYSSSSSSSSSEEEYGLISRIKQSQRKNRRTQRRRQSRLCRWLIRPQVLLLITSAFLVYKSNPTSSSIDWRGNKNDAATTRTIHETTHHRTSKMSGGGVVSIETSHRLLVRSSYVLTIDAQRDNHHHDLLLNSNVSRTLRTANDDDRSTNRILRKRMEISLMDRSLWSEMWTWMRSISDGGSSSIQKSVSVLFLFVLAFVV